MIEIRPTCIVIHNYSKNSKLENSLSVWDDITYSYSFQAFKTITKEDGSIDMVLPRGYSISRLKYYYPDAKFIDNTKKFTPSKKVHIECNSVPRNSTQQNAVDFLKGANYYSDLKNNPQKMIAIETSGGKTFISIYYMCQLSRCAMIIVDQNKIIRQWKEELLKLTNLQEDEIGIISGVNSIKKILKDTSKYKVYIASHKTLASYMKDEKNSLGKLFANLEIGLKIYDEAHVEWKNIIHIDINTNIGKSIYLTATPGRSNQTEDKIYKNVNQSIPVYGLENKYNEEKIYHKVTFVKYNTHPTLDEQTVMSKKRGFDGNAYYNYLEQEEKYKIFVNVIKRLLDISWFDDKNRKIAIVVHTLSFLSKLKNTLEQEYPDIEIGNFSGLIKDINIKDDQLNKRLILTTDKSFDKAINVMDLAVLINTVPMSSSIKTEQMLGRIRYVKGKKSMYFDLTDEGFTACRAQCRNRSNILKLKAKKTFVLKIN